MIPIAAVVLAGTMLSASSAAPRSAAPRSPVVDTGQDRCYGNSGQIAYPKPGQAFYGQDAQYQGRAFDFRDNGDGTVTDRNTGLMWQKTPDFVKRTLDEALRYAKSLKLAGHGDWRVPTIKELFSIADFRGNIRTRTPYIDTEVFAFKYPDTDQGWRIIDAQYRSSNRYLGTTMRGDQSAFGFNFADGRIKSYPVGGRRGGRQYVRCVRGSVHAADIFPAAAPVGGGDLPARAIQQPVREPQLRAENVEGSVRAISPPVYSPGAK